MNFPGLALRNLARRPARSLLTIFGVAGAVGSFIVLIGLSRGMDGAVTSAFDERGTHLTVMQRGAVDYFNSALPETLAPTLRGLPGVAEVSGEMGAFAPIDGDTHVLLAGWQEGAWLWARVPLREGRRPNPGEARAVVVGEGVVEALNRRVGDSITLYNESFRIVGITSFGSVVNRGLVIARLSDMQEVTFRTGLVTAFHMRVTNPGDAAAETRLRQALTAAAPNVVLVSNPEVTRNDRLIGMFSAVSLAISVIALFMGMIAIVNTLLMAVQERTREIGILAAIGWSRRGILALIMAEGVILASLGSALGIGLGFLGSHALVLVPSLGPYLEIRITAGLVLPAMAVAVALGVLGSLYPAFRAVTMNPARALQRA